MCSKLKDDPMGTDLLPMRIMTAQYSRVCAVTLQVKAGFGAECTVPGVYAAHAFHACLL